LAATHRVEVNVRRHITNASCDEDDALPPPRLPNRLAELHDKDMTVTGVIVYVGAVVDTQRCNAVVVLRDRSDDDRGEVGRVRRKVDSKSRAITCR
jgi:hypothetical protein